MTPSTNHSEIISLTTFTITTPLDPSKKAKLCARKSSAMVGEGNALVVVDVRSEHSREQVPAPRLDTVDTTWLVIEGEPFLSMTISSLSEDAQTALCDLKQAFLDKQDRAIRALKGAREELFLAKAPV